MVFDDIVRQRVSISNPSPILGKVSLIFWFHSLVAIIGRVAQAYDDRHFAFHLKSLFVLLGDESQKELRLWRFGVWTFERVG